MRKRVKISSAAAAALVALALSGSAIASATRHTPSGHGKRAASVASERPSATDMDNIQSGDQAAPDSNAATASASASETPDAGSRTESSSASDGPGGHEDPEGNVDYQSESQD